MDKELFDKLVERKQDVLIHFEETLGLSIDDAEFLITPPADDERYSIDIAIFPPSEDCPYYLATTVGLSCYKFNPMFARCELFMVLPKNYKINMDKEDNSWPIDILHEFSYLLFYNKMTPIPNQVYKVLEDGHFKSTKATDIIVVYPEMFDLDVLDEEIEGTFTRFFQVVPITPEQTQKAEEIGVRRFIDYDLHNTEGPDMVVSWAPKTNKKMEQIIKHNEDSLKGKK